LPTRSFADPPATARALRRKQDDRYDETARSGR
jgi:hypothetical protein